MSKTNSKLIRFSDDEAARLSYLAKQLGVNESEAIRQLIPPKAIVDALMEYHLVQNVSGMHSPMHSWWEAAEAELREFMKRNAPDKLPVHPLQRTQQTPEGLARVFTAFCRALRGVAGYRIATVEDEGERWILVNDGNHCQGQDERGPEFWQSREANEVDEQARELEENS